MRSASAIARSVVVECAAIPFDGVETALLLRRCFVVPPRASVAKPRRRDGARAHGEPLDGAIVGATMRSLCAALRVEPRDAVRLLERTRAVARRALTQARTTRGADADVLVRGARGARLARVQARALARAVSSERAAPRATFERSGMPNMALGATLACLTVHAMGRACGRDPVALSASVWRAMCAVEQALDRWPACDLACDEAFEQPVRAEGRCAQRARLALERARALRDDGIVAPCALFDLQMHRAIEAAWPLDAHVSAHAQAALLARARAIGAEGIDAAPLRATRATRAPYATLPCAHDAKRATLATSGVDAHALEDECVQ
jgi:hypothetical protein